MKKLKLAYPVIVEGKYDRLKLLAVCEGLIIKTDGFGVFKRSELASLIRALAKASPVIVLTDSDGGGKVIRSHISSLVPKDRLIQLYIPKIEGKEKRKSEPSKEGTLGVEGMENELIYKLLLPFSSDFESENGENSEKTGVEDSSAVSEFFSETERNSLSAAQKLAEIAKNPLSKVDFYVDGLTGGENSSAKRDALAEKFGLPAGMTPNALLEALKVVATYDEYLNAVGRVK
ncbi:MAG: DUF4093 domain-containing protein [Eubacteriales bacterium]